MPRTLSDLQQSLKENYQRNAFIERLFYPDNPLPLEECFLELALIEESKKISKRESNLSNRDKTLMLFSGREYFLKEYENTLTISRTIAISELMTLSRASKMRIYIEGAAGAGKSTLARYLAYHYLSETQQSVMEKFFSFFFMGKTNKIEIQFSFKAIQMGIFNSIA